MQLSWFYIAAVIHTKQVQGQSSGETSCILLFLETFTLVVIVQILMVIRG